MNKGEIWIVEIPEADGHEQRGKRPVVILATTESNIVIIVPFTCNMQALRFPNTIEIEPSKENGLSVKSVALIFQIRAIDKKRLKAKIGSLEIAITKRIDNMLRRLLNI